MTDFTLYGEPDSGSFTPEAMLAMVGAPTTLVDLDLTQLDQRKPAFLAINPVGRIPALVTPDGTLLTESVAIVLHLAERFPEAGFLPPIGSSERAKAYRVMMMVAGEVYPAVTREDYPQRFTPTGEAADAIRAQALVDLQSAWALIERTVITGPFVLGDTFSAADIYVTGLSRFILEPAWRQTNLPKIEAIAHHVAHVPPIRPVYRRHFSLVDPINAV